MKTMPLTLDWVEIARRLALTMLAGILIGLNRSERGRAAGLRTTCLVCMAASVAMIQTNLLLATAGKAANSFVVMDIMRLPLGILTGMGFIGAGSILRQDQMVIGVTTAATMWFVTVVGLCFGGGQAGLGLASLALGLVVLWCLRWFEMRMRTARSGTLNLVVRDFNREDLESGLRALGFRITTWAVTSYRSPAEAKLTCEIRWNARADDTKLPPFLNRLSQRADVTQLEWSERLPNSP